MKPKYKQPKDYIIMGILSLICSVAVLVAFYMNKNLHFSFLTYLIAFLWLCIAIWNFWYFIKARKNDLR
ncbi:MAG: hypothetical protein ACLRZ9_08085 [Eubacterium sp.]